MTRCAAPALQLSFGILLLFYCYCTGIVLLSTGVLLVLYWCCTAFYCCSTAIVLLLYWLWTGLVLDRDCTGIGRTPATRPCYQLLYRLLLEAG